MADTPLHIPAWVQTAYATNFRHALQQSESMLSGTVVNRPVTGAKWTTNFILPASMKKITARMQKTELEEMQGTKRWGHLAPYADAKGFDEFDQNMIGTLGLPTSPVLETQVKAANRTKDEVIITAALGNAYEGENGLNPVALPGSQIIGVNEDVGGTPTPTGLTLAKLSRAKFLLDKAEVPQSERYLVYTAEQLMNMLKFTEVNSFDYNQVKALVDGTLSRFMGFNFVMTELLPVSNDVRTCLAYWGPGIELGIGKDTTSRISIRDDLNEAIQVRSKILLGALRSIDEAVVAIECEQESES